VDEQRGLIDGRTAAEWLAQAERYERMAAHLARSNHELSEGFLEMAKDARERAQRRS